MYMYHFTANNEFAGLKKICGGFLAFHINGKYWEHLNTDSRVYFGIDDKCEQDWKVATLSVVVNNKTLKAVK